MANVPQSAQAYDDDTTLWVPPATFPVLTPRDGATTNFDEVLVNAVAPGGGRQEIYVSRSMGAISRWRLPLKFPGDPGVLKRVDGGQSMGPAEFWHQSFGTASEFLHNPTMCAAGVAPRGAPTTHVPFPPVPFLRVTGDGGVSPVIEGCTIPLEYGYDDRYGAIQDHGGNVDTHVLYWRMRMYQRVEVNWLGRENLHRVEYWSYYPREISGARGGTAPWLVFNGCGVFLVNHFGGNYGEFFDAATGFAFPMGAIWTGSANLETLTLDRFAQPNAVQAGGTVVGSFPYPLTADFGCAILTGITPAGKNIVTGICGSLLNGETEGQTRPNRLTVNTELFGAPVGEDTNGGQFLGFVCASLARRRAGWIGMQYWFSTSDDLTEVREHMRYVYRSGRQRSLPFNVPAAVIDGMVDATGRPFPLRAGPYSAQSES